VEDAPFKVLTTSKQKTEQKASWNISVFTNVLKAGLVDWNNRQP